MSIPLGATAPQISESVRFLWLELTNLCNLQCVHCYAESSPFRAGDDLLEPDDYHDVLSTAAELGCKQVQFIGGEPTLNRHLPDFIAHARSLRYEFVEVFTNLTRLSQPLLNCFVEHDVRVATSVYSHRPEIHDEITKKPGSHHQTMRGIDVVLAARLRLRAGVITMPLNQDHVEETVAFLRGKGVPEVGTDHVREFGRGSDEADEDSLANLCGNCAGSTLCVAPSGAVSPCIMSKAWSVGSILQTPLTEVVESDRLRDLRRRIYDQTVAPRERARIAPMRNASRAAARPAIRAACRRARRRAFPRASPRARRRASLPACRLASRPGRRPARLILRWR